MSQSSTYTLYYWYHRNCSHGVEPTMRTLVLPQGKGIGDISNGVWVDVNGQWTNQSSDTHTWIPSSQYIKVVKKKSKELENS